MFTLLVRRKSSESMTCHSEMESKSYLSMRPNSSSFIEITAVVSSARLRIQGLA